MRLPSEISEIRQAFLTMGPFIKQTLCFTAVKLASSKFGWNFADLAFQPK
jgi:hypothetical protein